MHFKDVLLALTTYPEPTPISALDDAVSLAVALGARISAIACEVKFQVPGSILGKTVLDIPAMVAAEVKKSAANAERLLVSFQEAAEKSGVFQQRVREHCLTSQVPDTLIEHARLRDLTIVPVPEGDHVEQWYSESIIFGSGRPTIILPLARGKAGAASVETVVVAWDFSRAAARAVADSLPILENAKHTFIVTVTNEKVIDTKRSAAELAKHLALHGVDAVLDSVDAAGRRIGEVLKTHVRSRNADLLVMGAYGHSRLREFILGGTTRSLLAQPPVPIFLSH